MTASSRSRHASLLTVTLHQDRDHALQLAAVSRIGSGMNRREELSGFRGLSTIRRERDREANDERSNRGKGVGA